MSSDKHKDSAHNQHKIHLVGPEEGTKPNPGSEQAVRAANRIEIGEYFADILLDRRSYPEVVHWIVQRRGSPEIIQWGHEDNFEAASKAAVSWIESLVRFDEYRNQLNR